MNEPIKNINRKQVYLHRMKPGNHSKQEINAVI